jgi:hypothetical protein
MDRTILGSLRLLLFSGAAAGALWSAQTQCLAQNAWQGTSHGWDPIMSLVSDIGEHHYECAEVAATRSELLAKCADQRADLLARQKKLKVSDDTVNHELDQIYNHRDWRWP